jgi:hypothetical protein
VQGSGSIVTAAGNQATFNMNVSNTGKKSKPSGAFSYSDEGAAVSFSSSKITSLLIEGNHAHLSGTAKTAKNRAGKGKSKGAGKISFTVDVIDNGDGASDTFSIQLNTGYNASGNLTSGNIVVH